MTLLVIALAIVAFYAGMAAVKSWIFKKRHHAEFHETEKYPRVCWFCKRERREEIRRDR